MSRLPLLTNREDVPPEAREQFDAVGGTRGGVRGPFAVMFHSPEVAARTAHLGTYLRFESALPPALREVATLVAARAFDCGYEWAAHARLAREAGVDEAVIETIATAGNPAALPEDEGLIVRYGRALLGDHRVDDATFEAVRGRWGERGLVDLTATMGYYAMVACMLNAAGVQPAADAPALPALP